MSDPGLRTFYCLCSCLLVLVNLVWMVLGFSLVVLGALLSAGGTWEFGSFKVAEFFETLSTQLNSQFHAGIDVLQMMQNLSAIAGTAGVAFVGLGAFVMLLCCIGCCGVCCRSRLCLALYLFVMALLFFAQLLMMMLWFANSDTFKAVTKRVMQESLRQYTGISSANVQSLLQNTVQIYVGCCGVNNGSDFHSLSVNWDRKYTTSQAGWNNTFTLKYPVSCCKFDSVRLQLLDPSCPQWSSRHNSNHMKGCHGEIFSFIQRYLELHQVFYALGGIVGVQVIILAGALVIYHDIANKPNKVHPA